MHTKPGNPARILIVEDNPADVYLLRHGLDQHGEEYLLEVLQDGEEALRFVEHYRTSAGEPEPCVIILDLHLPKHDGTAVLHAIRREPVLAHVQVVALSSLAAPQDETKILDLGVRLYRTKPTELDAWIILAGQILEICRESRQAVLV
jgi:two-component system response regulator